MKRTYAAPAGFVFGALVVGYSAVSRSGTLVRLSRISSRRAKVTTITLHDLRDAHASLLAKAGIPSEVISHRTPKLHQALTSIAT